MSDQTLAAVVAAIVAVSALVHGVLAIVGFTARRGSPSSTLRPALRAGRWRLSVIAALHAIPLIFALSLARADQPSAVMMSALWIGGLAFAFIGVVGIATSRLGADQPGGALLSRVIGLGALIGGTLAVAAMATLGG